MVNQLNGQELIDFLRKRDDRKYVYLIMIIENAGARGNAITDVSGFECNGDIAVVQHLIFDGNAIYFETSSDDNLRELYKSVEPFTTNVKEVMFASDDEAFFGDPVFIELAGKHDCNENKQYGMFDPNRITDPAIKIRALTADDEELVAGFEEPVIQYRDNLKTAFARDVKNANDEAIVFAAFDPAGRISGYLIVDTLDGKCWDISYIFVLESSRGKGIATDLVRQYAKEISARGGFALYGTPDNDASEKVAIAAGFELFEKNYVTAWIKK